jgi:hypothetical protein
VSAAGKPSSWASCAIVAAALVPILAAWAYKVWIQPRPYWVAFYDPEVSYYLSGLDLLHGRPPILVEHPGLPAQMLGAVLAGAAGLHTPFEVDRFRTLAYVTGALATVAGALLLARTLLSPLPPLVQVAGLWVYFAWPRALQYDAVWSPECLFFGAGAFALAAAWRFAEEPSRVGATLLGATVGACIALKFTFAAWLPGLGLCLWWSDGTRGERASRVAAAALALAASFVMGTFVAAERYVYMFGWLFRVATHSGLYGLAAPAWPKASAAIANLERAWDAAPLLLWVGLVAAMVLAAGRALTGDGERSLALLALGGIPVSFAAALRDLQLRYLFPAALLSVALFAIAVARRRGLAWEIALLLLVGILLGRALEADLVSHESTVVSGRATHAQVAALVRRAAAGRKHAVVVYGWRAPEPAFALRVAAYARAHHLAAIERRYPDVGDYEAWNGLVHLPAGRSRWDVLVVAERDLPSFPEPVGAEVGRAGGFVVLRAL